jgi:plasmid segregation protein ParM
MSVKIGIDVGYGNTKVVSTNGSGVLSGKQFKSLVGKKGLVNQSLAGFAATILEEEFEGVTYLLGASADQHSDHLITSRDKGWITTTAFKVLVQHAIKEAIDGKDTTGHNQIVTGLPVKYFNTDKETLAKVITEIAGNLGLKVDVEVIYQPLGSYMNMILDEGGGVPDPASKFISGKVGILDVGYYTADLVTIENRTITESLSMSVENGISSAYEAIKKDIEGSPEFGHRPTSLLEVENSVRSSYKISSFGEDLSIRDIASKRFQDLVSSLTSTAHTLWHNGANLDRIILTGGGAALLEPYWKIYKHAQVVKAAGLANANGYCKYAARIGQRSA